MATPTANGHVNVASQGHSHSHSNHSTIAVLGPSSNTVLPATSAADKAVRYRGAVVEDLQLPPAVCLPTDASVSAALELAYDHDFTQLPLLSPKSRKLVGYADMPALKARLDEGTLDLADQVGKAMIRFKRGGDREFVVIEPGTGLAELEDFLVRHPFALITSPTSSPDGTRFVLAVATRDDLAKFVERRFGTSSTAMAAAAPANGI